MNNNHQIQRDNMKNIIRLGDTTSHGGKVISASSTLIINGKAAALLYDAVSCPKHGNNKIIECSPHYTEDNRGIAFHGCKSECGAIIYSSCDDMEI